MRLFKTCSLNELRLDKRVFVIGLCVLGTHIAPLQSVGVAPVIEEIGTSTKSDEALFAEAVRNNDIQTVTIMLARDKTLASRTSEGVHEFPLGLAVRNGNVAIVKMLLQNGADPNKSSRAVDFFVPLGQAIASNNSEIARVLLDAGANVNQRINGLSRYNRDTSPLMMAIDKADKNLEFLNLLLAKKPDVSQPVGGETPIHRAIYLRFDHAAKALIEAGARLDERDERGNTLLMQTVSQGYQRLEMTKLLVERGADVNASNKLGETPLHLAVAERELVEFLVSKGAHKSAKTRFGDTPAHYAARKDTSFDFIAEHFALRTINQNGDTPLGVALANTYGGNADLLITNGDMGFSRRLGPNSLAARAGLQSSARIASDFSAHRVEQNSCSTRHYYV